MKIKSALMQGGAHSIAGTKRLFVLSLLIQSLVAIYLVFRFFYDVEWMGWMSDTSALMMGGIYPLYHISVIRELIKERKIKGALMHGGGYSIAGTKRIFVLNVLIQSLVAIYLFMRFFLDVEWMGWMSDTAALMLGGIYPLYQIFVIRGLITDSSGCHTQSHDPNDAKQQI